VNKSICTPYTALTHSLFAKLWVSAFIIFLFSGCQSNGNNYLQGDDAPKQRASYSIYLAGPEVFLPNPIEAGITKKATITRLMKEHNWPFDLVGLYPMDNEIADFAPDFKTGIKIYQANIDLMKRADYVTANMVRFRGPSMDVGTAFEMGYMRGLDKPVFAYYDSMPFYGVTEEPGIYSERVAKHYPLSKDSSEVDVHGQSIENFEMADNLMMIGAINDAKNLKSNQKIAASFEDAIIQIAKSILDGTGESKAP
jgi:nucleoside 2-deoxyribosyltransferase